MDRALGAIRHSEEGRSLAEEWLELVFRDKRSKLPPKWSDTFAPEPRELIRFCYVDDAANAPHDLFKRGVGRKIRDCRS